MNNEPEDPTGVIILDRVMNKDECKAMCTSPQIPLREKLFFRMIYETTTRPREVLEARIELWNRNTGEITFPRTKSKYNRWTRRHMCASINIYCHDGQHPERSLCFHFQQSRKQVQKIYQYELFAIFSCHVEVAYNVEDFSVFHSSFSKLSRIAFYFFA